MLGDSDEEDDGVHASALKPFAGPARCSLRTRIDALGVHSTALHRLKGYRDLLQRLQDESVIEQTYDDELFVLDEALEARVLVLRVDLLLLLHELVALHVERALKQSYAKEEVKNVVAKDTIRRNDVLPTFSLRPSAVVSSNSLPRSNSIENVWNSTMFSEHASVQKPHLERGSRGDLPVLTGDLDVEHRLHCAADLNHSR